jgi:hypothetical protein
VLSPETVQAQKERVIWIACDAERFRDTLMLEERQVALRTFITRVEPNNRDKTFKIINVLEEAWQFALRPSFGLM